MAQNWLRITHQDDKIQLSWQRGYESPRFASEVGFQQPFDEENAAELRWYLEDYLKFPYGIFPDNAVKIEQKLQHWGQQLFELVFRSTDKAREFFQEATREGLDNCELGIISDNANVLNLPWELLYSPDYQFLAPSLAGMYRSLSSQGVKARLPPMPNDQLNILLVIARPDDEQDVGFKTIARPLLAALQPIRQRVNLKVLRPPSLKEFEAELQANKGFYHIVHFDGHGNFDSETQGVLVFEDEQGNEQSVSAKEIAQYLTDCRVPIFVLNACKSGQVGEEAFSSVAGQLVKLGAKGVVAMAYSVYAKGAEHFIGRLYGELVRGECIATAVAAGRKSMSIDKMRPSPKGNLPLQDWLVPVLYQQEPYTPFVPQKTASSFADLMAQADNTPESSKAVGLPDESAYGFIGRDYEILRLERAFRQNHLVLVQGMGGVGKTELAAGFARWLDDTQGREHIFFTSFEQGAGLSQVINQIGRALGGERFSQMMPEQQEAVVREYLQTHPCLLIWDNFEPVNGFPTGNEPLLNEEERNKLKRFLKELRGGKSWVLITSRREEPWLDCGYSLINLRGLSQADAQELAAKILQTVGVERKNLPAEYLELLKLLGGHPLSLRVVLPHLKIQTPVQLIEALRRGLDTFRGAEEEGREKSLTVSLDYSFAKLSEQARRHLPFLGLFSERFNADWLHFFLESPDDEYGQAYQAVFRENLQKSDWMRILNEAVAAGIIEYIIGDTTIYKIHPALPWYLRQQLNTIASQEVINELEKKLLIFYASLADNYSNELISNAELAILILRIEEPNLLQNLRLAEQQQEWAEAQSILQALANVYQRIGRKPEFKSLRQRALNQIGIHLADAKAKGKDAFIFWTYLRGQDANEEFDNGELNRATAIRQEIMDEIAGLDEPYVEQKIATQYHELAVIAQKKRDFLKAIELYNHALKIAEKTENWQNIAIISHNLGIIAQEQGNLEAASNYHKQASYMYENASDLYSASSDYYELGLIALQKRNFQEATNYLNKALKIRIDLGDLDRSANVYYGLGLVAYKEGDFDEAIVHYQKAVKIKEDANDFYGVADIYSQIGIVKFSSQKFDDAIAYSQKAIKIYSNLNNPYQTGNSYYNLGTIYREKQDLQKSAECYKLAYKIYNNFQDWSKASKALNRWGQVLEAQENYAEALQIYIRVLSIDLEHNQDWIGSDIDDLGRMLQQLGESQFQVIWREVTSEECAGEVREAIWQARDRLS
ncbi:tetratricopeptide repeat protein [Nostoc sp.]|uniref:tetratricopeptide repeat protein n=1 Tax=Nostoc sp. TaxID=1180 RepID=UPI002FFB8FB5